MLAINTKNTGSNFMDETAEFLMSEYGYRAEGFLAEKIEVTLTGTAAEIEAYNAEAELMMLPTADEAGQFFANAEMIEDIKALIATL